MKIHAEFARMAPHERKLLKENLASRDMEFVQITPNGNVSRMKTVEELEQLKALLPDKPEKVQFWLDPNGLRLQIIFKEKTMKEKYKTCREFMQTLAEFPSVNLAADIHYRILIGMCEKERRVAERQCKNLSKGICNVVEFVQTA